METKQDLRRSVALYRAFKTEQSDPDNFYRLLADDAVEQVSRHVPVRGATVLDVGGGIGYSTDAFRDAGARCVLVEPEVEALRAGKDGVVTREAAGTPHWVAVAPGRTVSNGSIIGDGFCLPFADNTADISFSSNVLEHVVDERSFISELVRVTKPNGIIYVSFTNWYSPWGGHETRPWHYLGGEWSAKRYRRRTGFDPVHHFGHSLFPVHIGPLLRWAQRSRSVEILEASPRYYPSWCRGLVKVPGLREVATWNLLLILRKKGSPSELLAPQDEREKAETEVPALSESDHLNLVARARYRGRWLLRQGKSALGREPAFLPLYLRLTPLGTSRRITESTDLVVEGFPRSGNTFTSFAIDDASGHELTIASHVHQPSQIKLALSRGVPTVFVVRDPLSALASYLVYDRRFSPSDVINEYCSYHRQLVPYAERLLVCEFEEVTSQMPSVIERINQRFSLQIPPFDDDPLNVKQVMARIEMRHRLIHPSLDPAQSAATPHLDRRNVNEQMREALLDPNNAAQMQTAQELYEYFCAVATRQREALSRGGSVLQRTGTD